MNASTKFSRSSSSSAGLLALRLLRLRPFDQDVGRLLAVYTGLLAIELGAIGGVYEREFAGSWELASARQHLGPIGLVLSLPIALSTVLIARLAQAGRSGAVGLLGAFAGAAVGVGVSTGRRMVSLGIRLPFVSLVAVGAGLVAWWLARMLPRVRPTRLAIFGVATAAVGWASDAFVLPRLYPAMHAALFVLTLMAWSAASLWVRRSRIDNAVALAGIVATGLALAWAPDAARRVALHDNVKRVMVERAPFVGRAARLASQLSPPPPMEEDAETSATLAGLRGAQGATALRWQGRDIVVVTIDALRADHVSSYGYKRQTTPHIDALAARGLRFAHAYCPTPHTSYSVASLMTGKYTKSLLSLGGEDVGETWADQLRRYGYRTAAFYPPAVFFIDEHRFRALRERGLGFEYRKEEFASLELRKQQIERYLNRAPREKPLFLWVHIFEPHEPYEPHAAFPFEGEPRFDAYDSEIAAADNFVGELVGLVEKTRPPGTVFMVSADHGEEHDDHGGRYHGTTVYEEQVRVPLVVVGPGVPRGIVDVPVQTIDLLPTTLAALDVPLSARFRGRDLGALIAKGAGSGEQGLAFAETDDYAMVARSSERLICAKKIGACTLFDVSSDPGEHRPVTDKPERTLELKKLGLAIVRETGKVEASELPEALRRALQGDRDALDDLALLLDDPRVNFRRAAAHSAFSLNATELSAQLARAERSDEDAEVRRWSTLTLLRASEEADSQREAVAVETLRSGQTLDERRAAALVLAERRDPRGEAELLAWWSERFGPGARDRGELADARGILQAFSRLHSKAAAPVVAQSLGDVRLRPYIVETLSELGDARVRDALLEAFSQERYLHLRGPEARALTALGERSRLLPPLRRFAGMPEPLLDAIAIAHDAGLLAASVGGWSAKVGSTPYEVSTRVRVLRPGPQRLFVYGPREVGEVTGTVDGVAFRMAGGSNARVGVIELGPLDGPTVTLSVTVESGALALWMVAREDELAPPLPEAWHGTTSSED